MFKKTDSLFSKKLQKIGITQQVQAVQMLQYAEDVLKERFGEGASQHAKPESIQQRTLKIALAHPAVGEQIRAKESTIIHDINERIGRAEIVRIQFTSLRNEF